MTRPTELKRAFEPETVLLRLDEIMPARSLGANVTKSRKYARIAASVAEIGLVEPLVVARRCPQPGKFLLLDGHARLAVLLSRGEERTKCIVASDDEAFTYNKRVAHLATIQEQQMIVKALARGTPEARIAAALNVDVKTIRARRSMLEGVCPEVIDRLKSRSVNAGVFAALKRMKPLRQIEATALMLDANNLNVTYARVLLAGTRPGELVSPRSARLADWAPSRWIGCSSSSRPSNPTSRKSRQATATRSSNL
jgi:hypothetical protein